MGTQNLLFCFDVSPFAFELVFSGEPTSRKSFRGPAAGRFDDFFHGISMFDTRMDMCSCISAAYAATVYKVEICRNAGEAFCQICKEVPSMAAWQYTMNLDTIHIFGYVFNRF